MVKYTLAHLVVATLWPEYMKSGNEHSLSLVLRYWFIQKILRINAHVPWPVHPTSTVSEPNKIQRGTRTPGLAVGCHIDGRNGIVFGDNVWVGPRVSIISMNHDVNDFTKYVPERPVEIGRDSWLAANSVILPGVKLGPHTIVAAGAVVTKSFPVGNQILAGVPAHIVKHLRDYGSVGTDE